MKKASSLKIVEESNDVLEKGKIVEEGNHEVLLENKGLYYTMWRQQIGERESVSRYAAS